MGKVTESIYDGKSVIVPLADVQHIEKQPHNGALVVVTKHTVWNAHADFWANNVWIDAPEAEAFCAAWMRYRRELEAGTLVEQRPDGSAT